MKQQSFEQKYQTNWKEFESAIKDVRSVNSFQFAEQYRAVCQHLAICRRRNYSSSLIDYLQTLAQDGHALLYRKKSINWMALPYFLMIQFPRKLRELQFWLWISTACAMVPALYGFISVLLFPDSIYYFMSPADVSNMESMYALENHIIGEAREAETNLQMFGFYIFNNVGIDFRAYAAGLFFMVGAAFFMALNGLILGAVSAHMINVDLSVTFFPFVIAHGSFELIAMVIAGAAGLYLGKPLFAPGPYTRLYALQLHAKESLSLIYGAAIMTFIAAFIEAFWSAHDLFEWPLKIGVGAVMWVIVIGYLTFSGRGKRQ